MWELTARGAQEDDAPRPRARRAWLGARESREAKSFRGENQGREREARSKSLEKIRSYFILLYLWSRFHRSHAILLEVRLLVWTIGYYLMS